MRIARFTYATYALPLVRPWRTSRGSLTTRFGCLVCLHSRRGEVGLGEMAPLTFPDVKSEAEIAHTLDLLSKTEYWPRLELTPEGFDKWCEQSGIHLQRYPDLTFAVQCALAGLFSVRAHKPLRKLLTSHTTHSLLAVNAAIPADDPAEVMTAAAEAVASGFYTIKLKIGRRTIEEDLQLLAELRAAYPDRKFRVDANGAWSLRDARRFASEAFPLNIEFVEDPLRTPTVLSLKAIPRREHVPVGLDDTPLTAGQDVCQFYVVKPARYGTFSALQRIAKDAEQNDKHVIFTGSFESSVGLSYVASCAAAFGSKTHAHGLSTASWLAEDTLTSPLLPDQGTLHIPDVYDLPKYLLPRYKDELGIAS